MASYLDQIIEQFVTGYKPQQNKSFQAPGLPAMLQAIGGQPMSSPKGAGNTTGMVAPIGQQGGTIGGQTSALLPQQMPTVGNSEALTDAMMAYQNTQQTRLPGIAGGLEGVWDAFREPGKRRDLAKQMGIADDAEKQKELDEKAQLEAESLRRMDATYQLAMQHTNDPNKAKQLAILSKDNPEIAQKFAEQAFKPKSPANLQQEWEFMEQMPEGPDKEAIRQRIIQGERIVQEAPLKFGWRRNPETGDLEPDPGGPVDVQRQKDQMEIAQMRGEQRIAQANTLANINNDIRQINKSLDLVDGTTTGLIGAIVSKVPGTDAYELAASMDTQRASVAFQALLDMRNASKTGGALGNVSNREIELLYRSFAALDQQMKEGRVTEDLTDLLMRYERLQYMLMNEDEFLEEGISSAEMYKRATGHVNQKLAKQMGVPPEALVDLQDNPDTIDDFEEAFGYRPMQ